MLFGYSLTMFISLLLSKLRDKHYWRVPKIQSCSHNKWKNIFHIYKLQFQVCHNRRNLFFLQHIFWYFLCGKQQVVSWLQLCWKVKQNQSNIDFWSKFMYYTARPLELHFYLGPQKILCSSKTIQLSISTWFLKSLVRKLQFELDFYSLGNLQKSRLK